MKENNTNMKKKLNDFLLAAAIGDMMGVPYERGLKGQEIIIPHPSADYSDDTVCTFGVAKALINGTDIAKTLREACQREPGRGYGGMFSRWIYDETMEGYNSFGNGSFMRSSSVGYLAESEAECLELAKKTAEISHNHPEGIKGAQAGNLAIYLCLHGATKEEIKEKVYDRFYSDYPWKTYRDAKDAIKTFDVTCQGSIPPVFLAFFESTSFVDCLEKVYAYHSDTDTQGAMIAPIAYAFYGEIPENLLEIAKSKLPDWMLEVNKMYNQI